MTKQHILQEIKHIALANGGKSLGMAKFHKESGINYYDWFGKYWPRWSDAIREAGLAPNQMTVAYEETVLLEKLINLARELGHFPVKGDLRLKAYTDRKFPSDATFRRLGPKSEIISKVTEYCRRKPEFEDVLRICEAISVIVQDDKSSEEEVESVEEFGFVYLLKSGRFYKIGKTKSHGRREYELAIQLPQRASIIHKIQTDDPAGIEVYWHKRFESKRANGEWFDLSASDVKAFKRWLRIV